MIGLRNEQFTLNRRRLGLTKSLSNTDLMEALCSCRKGLNATIKASFTPNGTPFDYVLCVVSRFVFLSSVIGLS